MSGSKGQEIVYTWARLNTPTHKELSDTIDAALRRAKAEGVRLVQKEMEESGNQRLGGWINWCHARAAQIEEGE